MSACVWGQVQICVSPDARYVPRWCAKPSSTSSTEMVNATAEHNVSMYSPSRASSGVRPFSRGAQASLAKFSQRLVRVRGVLGGSIGSDVGSSAPVDKLRERKNREKELRTPAGAADELWWLAPMPDVDRDLRYERIDPP